MISRQTLSSRASLSTSATLSSYSAHFSFQNPWLGPGPLPHSLQVRDISGESKSCQFSQAPGDSQDGHSHQPWLRDAVTCLSQPPLCHSCWNLAILEDLGEQESWRSPQSPQCSRILRPYAQEQSDALNQGASIMEDRCPPPSWGCPPPGLVSDRPRHVGRHEAFPDPAPPCGLTLLSSASCSTRDGLGAESGQKRALDLCSIVLFVKTKKMSKIQVREWSGGRGSHT